MVDVVQLVEHRIVVPSVVGSSPIIHPPQKKAVLLTRTFFCGVDDNPSTLPHPQTPSLGEGARRRSGGAGLQALSAYRPPEMREDDKRVFDSLRATYNLPQGGLF